MKRFLCPVLIAAVLCAKGSPHCLAAQTRGVVVGANVMGVDQASEQQQDALIQQFTKYGVKTIRTALGGHGEGYTRFVIKAYQHGIGAVIVTDPYAGNTKKHALPADAAAGRPWGLSALSDADPEGFRKYFVAELGALETAGVHVTAFELGNELNTPRFNADFRPGQTSGRVLGVSDLENPKDEEASTVAVGYLAYLKVMIVLKDLRDHSKLNQKTPILTGMSADWGVASQKKRASGSPDAVSIPDSILYLRKHGVDQLVDGYGVHTYPTGDPSLSVPARAGLLEQRGVLSACMQGTKPCWMTEWGFNNASQSCPLDDTVRANIIPKERAAFKQFVDQRRLSAILYYSWSGVVPPSWDKTVRKEDEGAIFRCGVLTTAGRLALDPVE